jgi:hypothetical protein
MYLHAMAARRWRPARESTREMPHWRECRLVIEGLTSDPVRVRGLAQVAWVLMDHAEDPPRPDPSQGVWIERGRNNETGELILYDACAYEDACEKAKELNEEGCDPSPAPPSCPTCGQEPIEWRRQKERHIWVGDSDEVLRGGEQRYICPNGHFFDEHGKDCGTEMPPDVVIRHEPGEERPR